MKLKVIYGGENHLYKNDLRRFSNIKYKCIKLFRTSDKGLVGICKSKTRKEMPYRVTYGFSETFFEDLESAETFVKERFTDYTEVLKNE